MTLTEYNPQIYPFYLWVAKGADESLLDDFEIEDEGFILSLNSNAITTTATYHKRTMERGILVFGRLKKDFTVKNCAHEAVHVADFAFQIFGIKKLDYNDANEAYAYLVGWAANSIYK